MNRKVKHNLTRKV